MRKSQQDKPYYLYWIKRKEHNDIRTQGYIGISCRPDARFLQHKNTAIRGEDYHISRAIRKYDDIEFKTLCVGSLEYVADLENKLRPEVGVGWNEAIGGIGPSGHVYTEEEIEQRAQARTTFSKLTALNILVDYYENGLSTSTLIGKYHLGIKPITKIIKGTQKAYSDIEDVRKVLIDNEKFVHSRKYSLTEELYDEILTSRENGLSWSELEDKFCIPKSTIVSYCDGNSKYLKEFKCYRKIPKVPITKYSYKGKTLTLKEWSEEKNIKLSLLQLRLSRGWPIERALGTPSIKPTGPKIGERGKKVTYNGKTQTISQWSKELGINKYTLWYRFKNGYTVEDAFNKSIQGKQNASNIQ